MDRIDPYSFVSLTQPALQQQDWDQFVSVLRENWSPDQVIDLLDCDHLDAKKIAALAVGLVGENECLPELARKLRDPDRMVAEMAEHAMWQIWFRGGTPQANKHLARGAEALNGHHLDKAFNHLNQALAISPDFAEAYNQRAIGHYLAENYEPSVADCERTLLLMPLHFGAWSGMGHSYLAMGNLAEAQKAYEKAIEINPYLDCIVDLVQELRDH